MENVVGHRGSAEGQLCYELYVQTCAILAEHFHPNKTEKPNTVHTDININDAPPKEAVIFLSSAIL